MEQTDYNKLAANERMQELKRLHDELNTVRWWGADNGWDLAIAAVCEHIEERCFELAQKYAPETIDNAMMKVHNALPGAAPKQEVK